MHIWNCVTLKMFLSLNIHNRSLEMFYFCESKNYPGASLWSHSWGLTVSGMYEVHDPFDCNHTSRLQSHVYWTGWVLHNGHSQSPTFPWSQFRSKRPLGNIVAQSSLSFDPFLTLPLQILSHHTMLLGVRQCVQGNCKPPPLAESLVRSWHW